MEFRFIDPARDFSDGMQVLHTYHKELLVVGEQLLTLAQDIRDYGMNEVRANQCVHLHGFYMRANLLHHQDEEKALFPLLVNRSFLIDGMIERLALDHEEIEEAWDELAAMLGRPEHIADKDKLIEVAQVFEKLQRQHLNRENEDFFPNIAKLLGPDQPVLMGKTMARLRNLV
jgi:Uncharacterized conserved protein